MNQTLDLRSVKHFRMLDFSKSTHDSLDWLESFDFVKFTENVGLPAI